MRVRIICWTLPVVLAAALLGSGAESPFAVRIASLEYPRLGLLAAISGTVVLRLRLDNAGNVSNVKLLSAHPILAKAAAQSIKLWRFSPVRSHRIPRNPEFNFIYASRQPA